MAQQFCGLVFPSLHVALSSSGPTEVLCVSYQLLKHYDPGSLRVKAKGNQGLAV